MQKLVFESAWDKTIAPEDRDEFIRLFNETKKSTTSGISVHSVRQAKNHRNDLLAIVLVHNFSGEAFSFEDLEVSYFEKDKKVASHRFTFPGLQLEGNTSMPWTFIFPETAQLEIPTYLNGHCTIDNP